MKNLTSLIKLRKIDGGFIIGFRNKSFKNEQYISPNDFNTYNGLVAEYNCFTFRYRKLKPKWIFNKFEIKIPHPEFSKQMGLK